MNDSEVPSLTGKVILQARDIAVRIDDTQILDNIDLSLEQGEVLGLLGPNGAGKTTLLNCLAGLLRPSSGSISLNGSSVYADTQIRRHIGYMPHQPPLLANTNCEDQLKIACELYGVEKSQWPAHIDEVLELCDLQDYRQKSIGILSRGERQRLGLAQALVHHPILLILDEPGDGLDPKQTTLLREVIDQARARAAVILSSHLLSEVELSCSRVMVIDRGHVLHQQPIDHSASTRIRFDRDVDPTLLADLGVVQSSDAAHHQHDLLVKDPHQFATVLHAFCTQHNCHVVKLGASNQLEAAYLELFKAKTSRDA